MRKSQPGKIHLLWQALAIGVDILPQQRDILVALCYQLLYLLHDPLRTAAALPAAHIGHNAVGTKIIAAVHDWYPSFDKAIPLRGKILRHTAVILPQIKNPLSLGKAALQQGWEKMRRMGAKHQIHIGKALFQFFDHMGLFCHTSAQADQDGWPLRFELLEVADVAKNLVLSIFADGTGVKQNEVCFFRLFRHGKTNLCKDSLHTLAVRHILLAAKGMNHRSDVFFAETALEFWSKRRCNSALLLGYRRRYFLIYLRCQNKILQNVRCR